MIEEKSREGLEVLGVGFGRTGTLSTMTALNRLGLPCYHMTEVLKKHGHLDFWLRVANSEPGVQHPWHEVFSEYRATVDNPAAVVWRELLEANPRCKSPPHSAPQGARRLVRKHKSHDLPASAPMGAEVSGLVRPTGTKA